MHHSPISLLSWNTQKQHGGEAFIRDLRTLAAERHDFILLQEVDEAVRNSLQQVLGTSYTLTQHLHPQHPGRLGMSAIASRSDWHTPAATLLPYPANLRRYPEALHTPAQLSFGLTHGTYTHATSRTRLQVGNTHMPSRCGMAARLGAAALARDTLAQQQLPVVVGGDFNTGYVFAGENARMAATMAAGSTPLHWLSSGIGPTCYWSRLEPVDAANRLARRIGSALGIALQIDHWYGNDALRQAYTATATARRDITSSDHVPVQLVLHPHI